MANSLDFRFYALVVKRRITYFLLPFLVILTGALIGIFSLPKVYNSSAKILVESKQISDTFVKATVTTLAAERLEILKQRVLTRENLLRLVDKLNLYPANTTLSKTEIVDNMRSRIKFDMLDIGMVPKKGGRSADRLTVAFAVGFDSNSPPSATKVVNELVTIVLDEDARNRSNAANTTTNFMAREAERVNSELEKINAVLAEFKLTNTEKLPERLTFNTTQLERVNRDIEEAQRSIVSLGDQRRLVELEGKLKQTTIAPLGKDTASASALEQHMATLQLELSQKSAVFAPTHPEIRAMRLKIDLIQRLITTAKSSAKTPTTVSEIKESTNPDLQVINEKLQSLSDAMETAKKNIAKLTETASTLKQNVAQTPSTGSLLDTIIRKQAALQTSADELAVKLSQANLAKQLENDQQAERLTVIEAPEIPTEPVSPKTLQLSLLAFGASMAAGASTAFGAEFLDGTVRRGRDLETGRKNLRLLMSIPYISTVEEQKTWRKKFLRNLLIFLALIAAVVAIVHLFIKPVDLIVYGFRAKMNL